jgi:hypothetical protein
MKPHRLRGLASEYTFAAKYYEIIDDEKYSLVSPTIDTGWDFMISSTGIKIQVKRHTLNNKYNPYNLDLRRKRNKGTGNYTGKEFDYIAIHDTESDEFIIADVKQLMNGDKMKQSIGIRSLKNLGFGILFTNEGSINDLQ